MILLSLYWDSMQKELIEQYQRMGSRYRGHIVLIEQVKESERRKVLWDYYKGYKEEYLNELRVWMKLKSISHKQAANILVIPKRSSTKVIKSQPSSSRSLALGGLDSKKKDTRGGVKRVLTKNIEVNHMKRRVQAAGKPKFAYRPTKDEMASIVLRAAGIS
eukprot:TRINITY_DN11385_c0_g2_i4.p1 TRINITY_DN11385_c0_g2~~TRINITY_DN11385_c0_g2_i4.p1  ORF type:complete len:161 (-),score=44.25 TRINITY_DN11385_c0_g2_i4:334-816(-)